MADVASKQQTAALIYPPWSHSQEDKKTDKTDGKLLLCQRTFSSDFRAVLCTVKLHSLN